MKKTQLSTKFIRLTEVREGRAECKAHAQQAPSAITCICVIKTIIETVP